MEHEGLRKQGVSASKWGGLVREYKGKSEQGGLDGGRMG